MRTMTRGQSCRTGENDVAAARFVPSGGRLLVLLATAGWLSDFGDHTGCGKTARCGCDRARCGCGQRSVDASSFQK